MVFNQLIKNKIPPHDDDDDDDEEKEGDEKIGIDFDWSQYHVTTIIIQGEATSTTLMVFSGLIRALAEAYATVLVPRVSEKIVFADTAALDSYTVSELPLAIAMQRRAFPDLPIRVTFGPITPPNVFDAQDSEDHSAENVPVFRDDPQYVRHSIDAEKLSDTIVVFMDDGEHDEPGNEPRNVDDD